MSAEKISAVGMILAGLLCAGFARSVCRKERNVPQMRRLGLCLAAVGAILLFLP